jgi:hypothetical protein
LVLADEGRTDRGRERGAKEAAQVLDPLFRGLWATKLSNLILLKVQTRECVEPQRRTWCGWRGVRRQPACQQLPRVVDVLRTGTLAKLAPAD